MKEPKEKTDLAAGILCRSHDVRPVGVERSSDDPCTSPPCISAAPSVGGLIKFIIVHKRPQWREKVTLATSSFMGGEGVSGRIITFIEC